MAWNFSEHPSGKVSLPCRNLGSEAVQCHPVTATLCPYPRQLACECSSHGPASWLCEVPSLCCQPASHLPGQLIHCTLAAPNSSPDLPSEL